MNATAINAPSTCSHTDTDIFPWMVGGIRLIHIHWESELVRTILGEFKASDYWRYPEPGGRDVGITSWR